AHLAQAHTRGDQVVAGELETGGGRRLAHDVRQRVGDAAGRHQKPGGFTFAGSVGAGETDHEDRSVRVGEGQLWLPSSSDWGSAPPPSSWGVSAGSGSCAGGGGAPASSLAPASWSAAG